MELVDRFVARKPRFNAGVINNVTSNIAKSKRSANVLLTEMVLTETVLTETIPTER